jgi:Putative multicopper oxidases
MAMNRLFIGAVGLSALLLSTAGQAQLREYWIAAEKVEWNYAPSGTNLIESEHGLGVWGKTLRYQKFRYIGYTDATYSTPLPQPEWMGILGPQLRAVVGDTLVVHFLNRSNLPVSIHPHGVRYDQDNSGGDPGAGAVVPPRESFTYTWTVDEDAGPGPNDPSSIVWLYHSHVGHDQEDIYAGLIGTIVVTKRGLERSPADPRPRDVEQELTTLFFIFDEEDGEEPGLKHAMNGYIFGNLQGYEVHRNDRVRWHLVALGNEVDLHTAHWHGQTVLDHGRRTDVVELLPGSMVSVTMRARMPGDWLFHCHVADHMAAGMMTRWHVTP